MRLTASLIALMLTVAHASALSAQAALRPSPSGRATSEVTLAYPQGQAPAGAQPMSIRLDYGQPHLRGRTLHTDSLVPYDKAWRTGANAATTLKTDVDLVIGGATVPKGTYVLYTLPSRAGWKLIIQRSANQTAEYDPAYDVARVDLRLQALAAPIESLTMWLIPSTQPGAARGELRMAWGTTALSTDWMLK
jgi:hypothetical protein